MHILIHIHLFKFKFKIPKRKYNHMEKEANNIQIDVQEYLQFLSEECFKTRSPPEEQIICKINRERENSENLLMDFTSLFKQKGNQKRIKKPLYSRFATNSQEAAKENILIEEIKSGESIKSVDNNYSSNSSSSNTESIDNYEVPKVININQEEMKERKMMDIRRWFCISRPQYAFSCGISSLVSCWNYLFSTLGTGTKTPISQEIALQILGFHPPYNQTKFGSFTGNGTLMIWFNRLNKYFNTRGASRIYWKMNGKGRTLGISSQQAVLNLKRDLALESKAFIYHCFNHYCCPIGFEETPVYANQAYVERKDVTESDTWVIIGDPSRRHPVFHVVKWETIAMDISNGNPNYFDIRRPQKGLMQFQSEIFKTGKKAGGNLHCLILFEKLDYKKSGGQVSSLSD